LNHSRNVFPEENDNRQQRSEMEHHIEKELRLLQSKQGLKEDEVA
jgi:hypothetical protein